MKILFGFLLFTTLIINHSASSQNVSNVTFKIIGDRAIINYNLDKEADIYLYVSAKDDEGWNTSFMNWVPYISTVPALRAVKGDVGRRVSPGQNKQIVWSFKDEVAPFFTREDNDIIGRFMINKNKMSSSILNSFQFKVEACPPTVEPDMVWIDGGDGQGNYWGGRYPVTVYEFSKFIEETGYRTQAEIQGFGEIWDSSKKNWAEKRGVTWRCDESGKERDKSEYEFYPVVNVSWEDANAYCKWLSKKYDKEYFLPDFREWCEVCAGLPPGWCFLFGLNLDDDLQDRVGGNPNEIGWFDFNSDFKIHPIGKKRPNANEIYDMRGNMYEWLANPRDEKKDDIVSSYSDYKAMKEEDILNYFAAGGSAFEPYKKSENTIKYWGKNSSNINVGFRVFMYTKKNQSWKNYIPSK